MDRPEDAVIIQMNAAIRERNNGNFAAFIMQHMHRVTARLSSAEINNVLFWVERCEPVYAPSVKAELILVVRDLMIASTEDLSILVIDIRPKVFNPGEIAFLTDLHRRYMTPD